MTRRVLALLAAYVVLSVGYLAGFYFFGHLFAAEASTARPPVPFFMAFAISNLLLMIFFAWVERQMGHAIKAGVTIAVSQVLLVNVFYVMTGSRSVISGVASTLIEPPRVSWRPRSMRG